jgi:hypothetical protein
MEDAERPQTPAKRNTWRVAALKSGGGFIGVARGSD